MRKTILYISILLMPLLAFSCSESDGLSGDDSVDETNLTEDQVYQNVAYTRRVLLDLYGRVREVTNSNKNSFSRVKDMNTTVALLDNATDDGCGEIASANPLLMQYSKAAITASSNPVAGTHPWTWYYQAIRMANGFMERVDDSVLEPGEKIQTKAEARFLRALYYHEIYRWFGPFVILENRVDPFDKSHARASEADCVKWLVNEFDELIKTDSGLPDKYSEDDFGRATRGAALAYKARTLLYAASPLHKSSGVTWAEAAKAAKDMIDYAQSTGLFELYVDPENPAMSYKHLFNTRYNKEFIYFFNVPDQGQGDIYCMMPPFNPWTANKELSTCPTQSLIDSYDMADGTPAFTYDEYGNSTGKNPASSYDPQHPFADRDPRLDQTHLHDGMSWLINGTNETVDISTPKKWVSGYFVIKYFDENVDHMKNGTCTANFPSMRYAEVLLNYAEAANEAENSQAAREIAVNQLNQIRRRAGITKDLVASDFTQQTMRERIRRERRVELSWEEHRFFDIRRWQIGKNVLKGYSKGITKSASGEYSLIDMSAKSYDSKMDLSPLPLKDVNSCTGIDQNPGY